MSAGVLFGLTAGVLKLIGAALLDGVGTARVLLLLGSLLALGLMGTAVNQRAYQIAPIAFSMPMVNVVDIGVALAFGALVFGEVPVHSVGHLGLQALALCCAAWGLREIAALEGGRRDDDRTNPVGATR